VIAELKKEEEKQTGPNEIVKRDGGPTVPKKNPGAIPRQRRRGGGNLDRSEMLGNLKGC